MVLGNVRLSLRGLDHPWIDAHYLCKNTILSGNGHCWVHVALHKFPGFTKPSDQKWGRIDGCSGTRFLDLYRFRCFHLCGRQMGTHLPIKN